MLELTGAAGRPERCRGESRAVRPTYNPGMRRRLSNLLIAQWRAIIVLLIGAGETALAVQQLGASVAATDRERFANATDRLSNLIVSRIDTYVAMLRAGAALVDVDARVQAPAFERFVSRLELRDRYPGIQGIGLSVRVSPADVPSFVAARRHDHPDFRIWPEYERTEYHAIVFLEPLDRRNRAALGYDMFTDPTRRDAMTRARDTGEPSASGPVTLVQEIDEDKQHGFLIYVPVYRGGGIPSSVDDRRAALLGFIYSPFRIGDLFGGILAEEHPRAGFELFDRLDLSASLYRAGDATRSRFRQTRTMTIAGRPWQVSFFSLPGLDEASRRYLLPLAAAAGAAFTILVTAFVAAQSRTAARLRLSELAANRAERHARNETAALEEVNRRNADLYRQVETLLVSERAARAEAERMSRLKDEFLATLSHELRTPLNAIQGWAHMLTASELPPAKQKQALAAILRNSRVQAQLIDDLLDMSRIISGRAGIEHVAVDLRDVLDAAINVVRPSADAKGIAILMTVRQGPAVVSGDPRRLQQVFWNLLTNAVKFTPAGGHVEVRLRAGDGNARVEVADTGSGIDPAFLPHVFDRFRQADGSIAREHGGLGLGLAIVRSLVDLHAGTVDVASAGLQRGATFTVTLPLAAAGVDSPLRAPSPEPEEAAALSRDILAGTRILIVDDDADARVLMSDVLTEHGAIVLVCALAAEALPAMERHDCSLLISDIGMPQVDGYALIQQVRAHGGAISRIPAIAVTAYAAPEERARALASGFDLHVSKPIVPHELVRACAALLRARAEANPVQAR